MRVGEGGSDKTHGYFTNCIKLLRRVRQVWQRDKKRVTRQDRTTILLKIICLFCPEIQAWLRGRPRQLHQSAASAWITAAHTHVREGRRRPTKRSRVSDTSDWLGWIIQVKESQGFFMWRGVLGKNSLRAQGIAPKSFRVEASLKFDISCVGGACVWHVEWLFYTLQRKKYMTMIYAKYVFSSKGLWAAWTVLSCTLQPECRHWIHSRLLSYFKFTEKKADLWMNFHLTDCWPEIHTEIKKQKNSHSPGPPSACEQ